MVVEGSWEGIAGCVVCMEESVYVVGGCNIVVRTLSSNRMLYADVSTAILYSLHQSIHSMHKTLLCMYALMKTAELAVEISAFF